MTEDYPRSVRFGRREAIRALGVGAGFGVLASLDEYLVAAGQAEAGHYVRSQGTRAAGAAPFPKGAIVRTILKDVPPEALTGGMTLVHEHLSVTQPRVPGSTAIVNVKPVPVETMVEEVRAIRKEGVTCIVSCGTLDIGQITADVRKIAEQVARDGMHVVLANGLVLQEWYPPDIAKKTANQVADDFVAMAIRERWGALGEIGSDDPMKPEERKVHQACAQVNVRLGLPVITHTQGRKGVEEHGGSCAQCAMEQLDIYEKGGANLRNIAIGHLSDLNEPKAQTSIAICKRGAFVAFDTVGRAEAGSALEKRHIQMVRAIIDAGCEDQLLLSSDTGARPTGLKHTGGPGLARAFTRFVPQLRAAGVPEATIRKFTVENPLRWLAFVPRKG